MGKQIPEKFYFGVHGAYKNPDVFKINIGDISRTMIIDIVKVTFLLSREVRGDRRSTIALMHSNKYSFSKGPICRKCSI